MTVGNLVTMLISAQKRGLASKEIVDERFCVIESIQYYEDEDRVILSTELPPIAVYEKRGKESAKK